MDFVRRSPSGLCGLSVAAAHQYSNFLAYLARPHGKREQCFIDHVVPRHSILTQRLITLV
jgi:hypothetical protein